MARRKKYGADIEKLSLDLEGRNKRSLESLSRKLGIKISPITNLLFDAILHMDADLRTVLTKGCKEIYQALSAQTAECSGFTRRDIEVRKMRCQLVAQFMNPDEMIYFGEASKVPEPPKVPMNRYALKDGYLECPSNWILLNPSDAPDCAYAGVMEYRQHEHYGVPHFVYFSPYKYGCDYSKEFTEHIYDLCCEAWCKLPHSAKEGAFLAESALWYEDPNAGLFHIADAGERTDYPFGAKIYRI